MRILFYSAKSYDREYFEQANADFDFEQRFVEARLDETTLSLCEGYEAVCVFVNDQLDAPVLNGLADRG
ncbi:MAG: 2-hydroxyacid dehydrogenase, partial [Bacteroidota bacterium]